MRKMGGLRKYMPVTYATFVVGTLAIAGIPGLAGFFSKDLILAAAFETSPVLWGIGLLTAGLTSFYMFRLVFMTFWGDNRSDERTRHHLHESPRSMTIPLAILAVLSLIGGYVGLPEMWAWGNRIDHFLHPVFAAAGEPAHLPVWLEYSLMSASALVAFIGVGLAYFLYVAQPDLPGRIAAKVQALYELIYNKYWIDELYDAIFARPYMALGNWLWRVFDVGVVDGIVNGTARVVSANGSLWRRWQTGNVQHYAVSMLIGAVILLGYYALR